MPLGTGRKLSTRVAAAEALQLIGGFSDPKWLMNIAAGFRQFAENDGKFWGAYGNRVKHGGIQQVEQVVRKLCDDPTTRQAVVTLWNPVLDNSPGKRDYPCTVALSFQRRGPRYRQHSQLNMSVLMRSNDVWLGLPYDMFQFTQLQLTLCNILDLTPGTYTHTAWSLHLYLDNADDSYAVTDHITAETDCAAGPTGIGVNGQSVTVVRQLARDLARGRFNTEPSTSERWYLDVLEGHYAS